MPIYPPPPPTNLNRSVSLVQLLVYRHRPQFLFLLLNPYLLVPKVSLEKKQFRRQNKEVWDNIQVACESIRFSPAGGREARTRNTSAVRRLTYRAQLFEHRLALTLGLNINQDFFFLLSKALSRIIFSIFFRVSGAHQ